MDRVAVFVDAGYLCTGGAFALVGRKCLRSDIRLDVEKTFQLLETKRKAVSGLPLLRVYWYDGSIGGRLTTEQTLAARRDEIKLRLGVVNGLGEQKEVDTKLVTDLAELARNKAVADVILVGGDGDLRLGVELAQQHGVRVHLLTIEKTGVSDPLKMEADTWSEISTSEVGNFLSVSVSPSSSLPGPTSTPHGHSTSPVVAVSPPAGVKVVTPAPVASGPFDAKVVVGEYLATLSIPDKANLTSAISTGTGSIPADHNGRVLARARERIGRDLGSTEKSALRKEIKVQLGLAP